MMVGPRNISLQERLEKYCFPVTESGCWIWMGGLKDGGYGTIKFKRKTYAVHRLSWMVFKGPLPDNKSVLHHCDERSCFNPDHLFLGNHVTNAADMFAKGRQSRRDGEHNGRAKLTNENIMYIRSAPDGCDCLARKFGVHVTTIQRVRSGKFWKLA